MLKVCEFAPINPDEVGQDQSRVVGGNTEPSVPQTSHILDALADKEILSCLKACLWFLGSSDGVPLVCI